MAGAVGHLLLLAEATGYHQFGLRWDFFFSIGRIQRIGAEGSPPGVVMGGAMELLGTPFSWGVIAVVALCCRRCESIQNMATKRTSGSQPSTSVAEYGWGGKPL
jgi:hypothetical protein